MVLDGLQAPLIRTPNGVLIREPKFQPRVGPTNSLSPVCPTTLLQTQAALGNFSVSALIVSQLFQSGARWTAIIVVAATVERSPAQALSSLVKPCLSAPLRQARQASEAASCFLLPASLFRHVHVVDELLLTAYQDRSHVIAS